ncbi:hypothetical protein Q5Y75_04765 [Ruegeria sp. 2205SS24-7]|uniref:hypothetical protein n=1 Tax=Ruegeria discodermiae TaxID=3064389 RepID=UPI002741E7F7|nr:hypothetical protein [Ruegeria sp. 2205SS24-7]MDP5216520.1 hypothetical protein [Ruegeria sp. 2205SS24-7]
MTDSWTRIRTREAFCRYVAQSRFEGDGLRFVIRADGGFSGTAEGETFEGRWVWKDSCFCRTLIFDDEPPETDCEIIEICGDQMRYTRARGQGSTSVVRKVPL